MVRNRRNRPRNRSSKTAHGPKITIDPAFVHYIARLEVNSRSIAAHYDSLPYPDKPPIDNCGIFFSALHYQIGPQSVYGGLEAGRGDLNRYDPKAPPETHIIIFLGSLIKEKTLAPNEILGRLLACYAQDMTHAPYTEEEKRLVSTIEAYHTNRKALIRTMGITLFVTLAYGVLGLLSNADFNVNYWLASIIGANIIVTLGGRKYRLTRMTKLEQRLLILEGQDPSYQEAIAYGQQLTGGVNMTVRTRVPRPLRRARYGHSLRNDLIELRREEMISRPPEPDEALYAPPFAPIRSQKLQMGAIQAQAILLPI